MLEEDKTTETSSVTSMFDMIMTKLGKLDIIDNRMKSVEQELKEMKHSLEFVHAEVKDIKDENEKRKKTDGETQQRLEKLEQINTDLNNRVIDLQARSMRDNLIFYNVEENEEENSTEIVHSLLESNFKMDAKSIKIDRAHRMGKKQHGAAKFNYFPDKVRILANAKNLKGTNIGVSEQFPQEIVQIRKRLYKELKKAREIGKNAKLVRDKLYIDGPQLFREQR